MSKTKYRTCEWFLLCEDHSIATVEHPTLGDVEICQAHLDWLTADGTPSPTMMVPPMAARRGRALAERLGMSVRELFAEDDGE